MTIPQSDPFYFFVKNNFPPNCLKETTKIKLLQDCCELILQGKSLYIFGPVGTGKTQLAVDIIREIVNRRRSGESTIPPITPFFINTARLVDDLKTSNKLNRYYIPFQYLREYTDAERDAYQELSIKTHLVIDDLARERSTDWSEAIIYRLINDRYTSTKVTIITSNFSLDALANRIDYTTVSRIADMCVSIEYKGADRRLRAV